MTTATPVSNDNRNIEIGPAREIEGWTLFTFPGRGSTYSPFQWHWYHFDAIDYDQRTGERSIFRLANKTFETPVDPERGNYDYLMFADLDSSRDDVREETGSWGEWIVRTLGIDGFRLDAVRHIRFTFSTEWLDRVRGAAGRPLFAVGEYFSGNVATLRWYIEQTGRRMSLFDFPLHFSLRDIARGEGGVDMARIFDGTLVAQDPELAVTFVDNHDTTATRSPRRGGARLVPAACLRADPAAPVRLSVRLLSRLLWRQRPRQPAAATGLTADGAPRSECLRAADRLVRRCQPHRLDARRRRGPRSRPRGGDDRCRRRGEADARRHAGAPSSPR
ncbi:MAG: alpha-amylase family glycosyl hydrolase [Rhodospirillales bacterium]